MKIRGQSAYKGLLCVFIENLHHPKAFLVLQSQMLTYRPGLDR